MAAPLPPVVQAQVEAHPSMGRDRPWVLESLLNDSEVFLAQNRRFLSDSSRTRFQYRFRELHGRDAREEEWFEAVFGRPSLPDELMLFGNRAQGDNALTGYQLYQLLAGWVHPSRGSGVSGRV